MDALDDHDEDQAGEVLAAANSLMDVMADLAAFIQDCREKVHRSCCACLGRSVELDADDLEFLADIVRSGCMDLSTVLEALMRRMPPEAEKS